MYFFLIILFFCSTLYSVNHQILIPKNTYFLDQNIIENKTKRCCSTEVLGLSFYNSDKTKSCFYADFDKWRNNCMRVTLKEMKHKESIYRFDSKNNSFVDQQQSVSINFNLKTASLGWFKKDPNLFIENIDDHKSIDEEKLIKIINVAIYMAIEKRKKSISLNQIDYERLYQYISGNFVFTKEDLSGLYKLYL